MKTLIEFIAKKHLKVRKLSDYNFIISYGVHSDEMMKRLLPREQYCESRTKMLIKGYLATSDDLDILEKEDIKFKYFDLTDEVIEKYHDSVEDFKKEFERDDLRFWSEHIFYREIVEHENKKFSRIK